MGILDYFKPVLTIEPQKVREIVSGPDADNYNIIDVRQPREYEQGHLPGAIPLPLDQLQARMGEFDPTKPTVAYCASGTRSRSAAAFLSDGGFTDIKSMDGGIKAWESAVAAEPPEAGMAWFDPGTTGAEMAGLAWLLEEGTRRFYLAVGQEAEEAGETKAAELITELGRAEQSHKNALIALYRQLALRDPDVDFPREVIGTGPGEPTLEGGIPLVQALEWARGRDLAEVLEFMVAQEANALDLYLKMERASTDRSAREVFHHIATEERVHLERLIQAFEQHI